MAKIGEPSVKKEKVSGRFTLLAEQIQMDDVLRRLPRGEAGHPKSSPSQNPYVVIDIEILPPR